ncbi:hypothetical protein OHO83_35345 [Streptomyces sp. NBC_00569]|uniref:hypothetical protein n=1 Tax=Streptomyces sp. NBC_00569 TaxID=2975780 RepID=UPI002E81BDAC|nr:hypothetical protein [Streptomyces sp. NBC_00569]WUB97169.1 hypothetical protein OHO83_35345 [Streptomyces sp. NBC_00569]
MAALSPRLRKRLDAAVEKLAARPVTSDGGICRIAVDDETFVELHAPGGTVTAEDAIRCGCLLAPACVHRAAAAALAPIADDTSAPAPSDAPDQPSPPAPDEADATAPPTEPTEARTSPPPASEPTRVAPPTPGPPASEPTSSALPTSAPPASEPTSSAPPTSGPPASEPTSSAPPTSGPPASEPTSSALPTSAPPTSAPTTLPPTTSAPTTLPFTGSAPTTPSQAAAAEALWQAAVLVLDAGVDGAGAVLQAGLLRAAHTARLAALPRPAAAAIRTVNGLRAARAAEPGHRTAELADALAELLATAYGLRRPGTPDAHAALRGTARRAYAPGGSLRLYGLFTEPVLTSTGHAGVVTWTADAAGRLYTVPDVAPGGPARARNAGDRAVRMGDTALTHRDLARAGLVVSGATVSADGRLGAGRGVRAAAAAGADWTAEPLAALWSVPVAHQVARALAAGAAKAPRATGEDLLFLDATLTGVAREAGGDCLLAECDGLTVRLTAADDHPELAHRENLALLATASGTRVRAVARLVPAGHPRAALLAVRLPTGRYDLGLDRLQRQDVTPTSPLPEPAPGPVRPTPSAPLHILRRRTEQVVVAGRRALTHAAPARPHTTARHTTAPHATTPDTALLRRAGLSTAAELLDAMRRSAAERGRDGFGRLVSADTDAFARAWLATARYLDEASTALCREAWRT